MTQSATKNIFTQPLPPLQAPQLENQKPEKDVARTALIISITIFFAGILYLVSLGFLDSSEEFRRSIGIAGLVFLLTGSFGLIINAGFLKEKYFARISLLIGCIQFALMIAALTTGGALPVLGSIALLTTLLIGNYFFSGPRTTLFVLLGIFGGLAVILAGVFSPFAQSNSLIFTFFWSGILVAEAVIFTRFIITGQIARLLRMKIFFISIAISLVPLLAMSGFTFSFQQNLLEEKSENYVELAANNEAAKVNAFIDSNLNNLNQQSTLAIFGDFLELPISKRSGSPQLEELADTIETLSQSSEQKFLKSYGVIDANGLVVYDSYSPVTGAFEADQDYFRISYQLGEAYISSINFLLYPYDASEIIFSAPIKNKSEEIIGVIRMRYNADIFKSLLQTSAMEFGDQSFPLLIDEFGIRIVDNLHPDANYKPIQPLSSFMLSKLQHENRIPVSYRPEDPFFNRVIEQVIDNYKTSPYFSADVNPDQNTNKEIGYVIRLNNVPWYLVYIQDQTFASQRLAQQANNMTLVISIFIALAGLLSLGISRYISAPILNLTEAASQITKGNLEVETTVNTKDEIGALSIVFNSMARRLRTIINELEDRVAVRTRELDEQNKSLAYRSQQLSTIADVARTVVAEQDLEILLSQVTHLISERFDFYHVGIFLIDPAGQYAVLRAANSEGGQRMLARQHKLRVGQVGIVGFATGTGQARIATDVGEDSIYFNNPDLPRTRSEMALPLKDGDNVIGALDVQSTVPDAFLNEDIELFSTLADQVAVAIVNSRLYEETQETLKEMQDIHQQYLRESWTEKVEESEQLGYRYTLHGTTAADPLPLEEIKPVIESGNPITPESNTLKLPIILRGETIGIIQIQGADETSNWDAAQISTMEKVSDQIALALENARLFEETAKRADRDRKVLEITSKIRSTTDFNEMLEIAVNELKRELHASGAQIILQQNNANQQEPSPADNGHNL